MKWAVITLEDTNPRFSASVIEALHAMGEIVALVCERINLATQPRYVSGTATPSRIEVESGSEGLGYYLNRCIEESRELDAGIEWFLVLGGGLDPVQATEDVVAGVNVGLDTQLAVLGLGVDHLQPSSEDFLRILQNRRHCLLSGGAGGFMVINEKLWNAVSGFREDIGGWGTDIHFSLDCLAMGQKVLTMPWKAERNRVLSKEHEYLVATLVAFGTYARGNNGLTTIRSLMRIARSGYATSPKIIAGKVRRAREILRTRRFLASER